MEPAPLNLMNKQVKPSGTRAIFGLVNKGVMINSEELHTKFVSARPGGNWTNWYKAQISAAWFQILPELRS